jgi:hypothetical protein
MKLQQGLIDNNDSGHRKMMSYFIRTDEQGTQGYAKIQPNIIIDNFVENKQGLDSQIFIQRYVKKMTMRSSFIDRSTCKDSRKKYFETL